MINNILKTTRAQLKLGTPITYKNLCVFPIFNGEDTNPHFLGMKTALDKNWLEIKEVDENGSVPTLKAKNKSDLPIILIDGEEVEGAKQNRIINTTVLLAPQQETMIPVSCTESGRWNYNSRQFQDSSNMMSFGSRSRKSSRILKSLTAKRGYDAEQSMVWNDIEALHFSSGSASFSRTRAMKDAYEYRKPDIDSFLNSFPYQKGQKGMVVFKNGELAGMDFLSRSDSYADVHNKFIKSHVIEALQQKEKSFDVTALQKEATDLLDKLPEMNSKSFDSVGLGKDYRLENNGAESAVLVYQNKVVHWSAYNKKSLSPTKPKPTPPFEEANILSEEEQTTIRNSARSSSPTDDVSKKETASWMDKLKDVIRNWSGNY